MNFDDAMHVICPACDRGAGWHRMSGSGRLYCLLLNQSGINVRNSIVSRGETYDESSVYRIKVKFLQRSPLGKSVSKPILRGLNTYVEKS